MTNEEQAVMEWLAHGERGMSSNAMVQHLTGIKTSRYSFDAGRHPHDPDDLWRCRQLLKACPHLVAELPRMAEVSPEWALLVANWRELCRMMDDEAPHWPARGSSAPRTYDRMQTLFNAARNTYSQYDSQPTKGETA